jgi:hypothetical protein
LKELLKQVLPPGARERVYSVELIHKRWAEAVGDELARRSEPEALSQGVLTVRVIDPVWGKMIYKLQDRIIPALNRAVGSSLVRRINFTKRSRLERPPPENDRQERPPEPVEPPALVVEAAAAIEEPELRRLVLRSAARYLNAQQRHKSLRRK